MHRARVPLATSERRLRRNRARTRIAAVDRERVGLDSHETLTRERAHAGERRDFDHACGVRAGRARHRARRLGERALRLPFLVGRGGAIAIARPALPEAIARLDVSVFARAYRTGVL